MAKRVLQDNVDIIDNAITDKGTVKISMKSFKWIVGILISLSLFILGVAWGFKVNLESKFEKSLNSTKTELIEKFNKVENKIDNLERNDIKPNIQMDYRQDGDIKVLYDRTNSRQNVVNGNTDRPENLNTNIPNFNPNGN